MLREILARGIPRGVPTLLLALLLVPTVAFGLEIHLDEEYPLRDEPVEISLTGEGVEEARVLRVTYRPNSQTHHEEEIPFSGRRVEWTPEDAGVVRLEILGSAGTEAGTEGSPPVLATHRVSVRFGSFPPRGLAVMLMAAAFLFGGATFGFVMLLGTEKAPPEEEAEPPST
ncbi:MAG: hypothetical protein R3234_13425 [Thermoanaerobaculia bacterium]|nr:hypothetical protein [Thermoanaerobaculia bacterium]